VGILRLFLALCVVAGHSTTSVFGIIPPVWSSFAVMVFFIISGFYMALVMDGPYRNKPKAAFYLSRAARIYPAYWISLVFAAAVAFYVSGWEAFAPFWSLAWHQKIYAAFSNLFIFGFELSYFFCLAPAGTDQCLPVNVVMLNSPAWSISVEMMFYLLAPWLVRDLRGSAVLAAIGMAWNFAAPYMDIDTIRSVLGNSPHTSETALKYYALPSSFLFFGAGAFAYHFIYKRHILVQNRPSSALLYLAVVGATGVFALTVSPLMAWWQMLAFAVGVPALFSLTRLNGLDRTIGELSYPIYILHLPVVILLRHLNIGAPLTLGTMTATVSIVAGLVVFWLVDRPVDRWRHRMVTAFAARTEHRKTQGSLWVGDKRVAESTDTTS
jgi:peptidoglycan/LPS O-acetylase OafA/YrhL